MTRNRLEFTIVTLATEPDGKVHIDSATRPALTREFRGRDFPDVKTAAATILAECRETAATMGFRRAP